MGELRLRKANHWNTDLAQTFAGKEGYFYELAYIEDEEGEKYKTISRINASIEESSESVVQYLIESMESYRDDGYTLIKSLIDMDRFVEIKVMNKTNQTIKFLENLGGRNEGEYTLLTTDTFTPRQATPTYPWLAIGRNTEGITQTWINEDCNSIYWEKEDFRVVLKSSKDSTHSYNIVTQMANPSISVNGEVATKKCTGLYLELETTVQELVDSGNDSDYWSKSSNGNFRVISKSTNLGKQIIVESDWFKLDYIFDDAKYERVIMSILLANFEPKGRFQY